MKLACTVLLLGLKWKPSLRTVLLTTKPVQHKKKVSEPYEPRLNRPDLRTVGGSYGSGPSSLTKIKSKLKWFISAGNKTNKHNILPQCSSSPPNPSAIADNARLALLLLLLHCSFSASFFVFQGLPSV